MNKKVVGSILVAFGLLGFFSNYSMAGAVIGNPEVIKEFGLIFLLSFAIGSILLFNENLEKKVEHERVPEGVFAAPIPGLRYKKYKFKAFPGEEVVVGGRKEHLVDGRNHVTIYSPDTGELRVDIYTLKEIEGKKVPKDLKKYLELNRNSLIKQVERYYQTGKFE